VPLAGGFEVVVGPPWDLEPVDVVGFVVATGFGFAFGLGVGFGVGLTDAVGDGLGDDPVSASTRGADCD
jgi:hypothetical protein